MENLNQYKNRDHLKHMKHIITKQMEIIEKLDRFNSNSPERNITLIIIEKQFKGH